MAAHQMTEDQVRQIVRDETAQLDREKAERYPLMTQVLDEAQEAAKEAARDTDWRDTFGPYSKRRMLENAARLSVYRKYPDAPAIVRQAAKLQAWFDAKPTLVTN